MLNNKILDVINDSIGKITKKGTPLSDIESNIKAIVISVLKKLDIVTREEFDIQQQVLLATRKKLDELESKIDKLVK